MIVELGRSNSKLEIRYYYYYLVAPRSLWLSGKDRIVS